MRGCDQGTRRGCREKVVSVGDQKWVSPEEGVFRGREGVARNGVNRG